MASNPEFLREGSAVDDFLHPDRIIIGVEDERTATVLQQLYRPLTLRDVPLVITSCRTAELIKYAANSFLATRIGFINEMADLCEAAGCEIQDLARGIGLDRRIGQHYLHPGPGLGGSCFPKDTRALVFTAREFGAPVSIVEQVVASNERRKRTLIDRVKKAVGGDLKGRRISLLGIAFKADTDDVRESAALVLIPALQQEGAVLAAYDPQAMSNGRAHFDEVQWCADPYSTVIGADAAVILTEWNEFRGLNLNKLAGRMAKPILLDLRNLFEPADVAAAGLRYVSLGRQPILAKVPHVKLLKVGGVR
jgi:UDPglucose 6-dehydrogenase